MTKKKLENEINLLRNKRILLDTKRVLIGDSAATEFFQGIE